MKTEEKTLQLDPVTLKRIELLHPFVRVEGKAIYKEICERLTGRAMCRFTHTLRTFTEQETLFAQGRYNRLGPIVTNARPGFSYHNYGLAIDIALIRDKDGDGQFETASWDHTLDFDGDGQADWMEVVDAFEKRGWTWGGRWTKFRDRPHFQKECGLDLQDLLERHKKKDYQPKTTYVRI